MFFTGLAAVRTAILTAAITSFFCAPASSVAAGDVTQADLDAATLAEHRSHRKQVLYAASLAQRLTASTDPNIILDTITLQASAWIDAGLANKLDVVLDAANALARLRTDAMRISTIEHLRARARYFRGDDTPAIVDAEAALTAQRQIGESERKHPDPTRLYQQTLEFAFMLHGAGRDADLVTALRSAERLLPMVRDRDGNKIALDYLYSSLRLALGDRDAAIEYLDAALENANKVGDRGWIAEILGARSTLHLDAGETVKANEAATQYRALAIAQGNRLAEANAELYLAEAHLALGEPTSAYTAARRAVTLFDDLDDDFSKADARRELARVAASLGRANEAETFLREALALRQEDTTPQWSYRVARARTAIAIASGDIAAIKRAKDLEDKRGLLRQMQLSSAQTKALREFHEVNAREIQLQLLRREHDANELEMRRSEARIYRQRIAMAAGSAVLAIVGIALLLLYRRSRILREAAETDALTGAKSRGAILAFAESLWAKARAENTAVAACVIDIDHFKRFNDEYGHATGDQVLTRCVDSIRKNLRQKDAVGRIGGDEFLVVMADVDEAHALATARRIVEAVRTEVLTKGDDGTLRASISAGVAAMPPSPQSTVKQLIQRADAALIEAKNAGKDRVLAFRVRTVAAE